MPCGGAVQRSVPWRPALGWACFEDKHTHTPHKGAADVSPGTFLHTSALTWPAAHWLDTQTEKKYTTLPDVPDTHHSYKPTDRQTGRQTDGGTHSTTTTQQRNHTLTSSFTDRYTKDTGVLYIL